MMFKDNPELIIAIFRGGSYSHLDCIFLPYNQIKLENVKITNSRGLGLITIPTDDGYEQWTDWLKFKSPNESKRKFLLEWLSARIGKTINSIYKSEFSFEKHV